MTPNSPNYTANVYIATGVKVKTRALSAHCDKICGNEERAYPSLGKTTTVDCAKSLEHSFKGRSLGGVRWSDPNMRSAMIGQFSLPVVKA